MYAFKEKLIYLGDGFPLQVLADEFTYILAGRAIRLPLELFFKLGAKGRGERDVHSYDFLLHTFMMGDRAMFVKCWQELKWGAGRIVS